MVDPFVRKSYRLKGAVEVCEPGSAVFADGVERLRAAGSKLTGRATAIVVIEVQHAVLLVSSAYDDGRRLKRTFSTSSARGALGSANTAQAGNRLPCAERPATRPPL